MVQRRGMFVVVSVVAMLVASIGALPVRADALSHPTPGSGTWSSVFETSAPLDSVDCPSSTTCYAVGGATAEVSVDAGAHWTSETVATDASLSAVSCTSTTTCLAVGTTGIYQTVDGGQTWVSDEEPPGYNAAFGYQYDAVACASTTVCFAAGAAPAAGGFVDGTILESTNSGSTWAVSWHSKGAFGLGAITCPSSDTCLVSGNNLFNYSANSPVLKTTDSGAAWTQPDKSITGLTSLSCVTATKCDAASGGSIYSTANGGRSWSSTPVSTTLGINLDSISCPTLQTCVAGGGNGTDGVIAALGPTGWQKQTIPADISSVLSLSCITKSQCLAVARPGGTSTQFSIIRRG